MATRDTENARRPRRAGDEARARLLEILRSRQRAGRQPPTVRDLAAAMGLSPSVVHHHVRWLRDCGQLEPRGPHHRWGVHLPSQAKGREARHAAR